MNLFWIDAESNLTTEVSKLGYGVTALNQDDAFELLNEFLSGQGVETRLDPARASIRIVSDLGEIEQAHVLPNMGNHLKRGVWFPKNSGW